MTKPDIRIAAIVGSLRQHSLNAALLKAAIGNAPTGIQVVPFDLGDVPLYNGDIEERGDPASVAALKQAVADADGLLIVTPEYNRSVPAVTKNAVDWLSRPHGRGVLADKPVGIVAATPGRHDAAGVRTHLETAVAANTRLLFPESLVISSLRQGPPSGEELTDTDAVEVFVSWLARYGEFVAASKRLSTAA